MCGEKSPSAAFAPGLKEGFGCGFGEPGQRRWGGTLGLPPPRPRVPWLQVPSLACPETHLPQGFGTHLSQPSSGCGRRLWHGRLIFRKVFVQLGVGPAGRWGAGFARGAHPQASEHRNALLGFYTILRSREV